MQAIEENGAAIARHGSSDMELKLSTLHHIFSICRLGCSNVIGDGAEVEDSIGNDSCYLFE